MLFRPKAQVTPNRPADFDTKSATDIIGGAFDQPSNIDGNPRVKMAEFLQSVGLHDKYGAAFLKAGIQSVDDFMELDPDKLTVLNI